MAKNFQTEGAYWIGFPEELSENNPNQYYEFSRKFILNEAFDSAILEISVDSDYAVWINGKFVNCGQYGDLPKYKVYDELPISSFLKRGENIICIQVYCQGEPSNNYYGGSCGLLYTITGGALKIVSDENTLIRKSNTYRNGYTSRNQMGFTFEYNSINEDSWIEEGLMRSNKATPAAILTDYPVGLTLNLRPIHKFILNENIHGRIIAQGVLKRIKEGNNHSETMFGDYLSSRRFHQLIDGERIVSVQASSDESWNGLVAESIKDNDGIYLVIDFDQEETGLLEFIIDAKAGTVLDIAVGEHLDDLRVRSCIGGRNFAHRYICKSGMQHFTNYFARFGGRYLELHVTGSSVEKFRFQYIGARRMEYPIDYVGSFKTNDALHNRIYEVAVRTLKLCMHEHYEDCPWREQALYALDARNQALCGYYCYGDYEYAKASLWLLAKSVREDGYLDLCPPGQAAITIPLFTLAFIKSLEEYVLYSGDVAFAVENRNVVIKIISAQMSNIQDGLLVTPSDVRYWNFYEWAGDLSGEPIIREEPLEYRMDAPLNLFFIIALDSASFLMNITGEKQLEEYYRSIGKKMRIHYHNQFFDPKVMLYRTYIGLREYKSYSELTQSLALYADVVPDKYKPYILDRLVREENGMTKITLSQSIFKFEALLKAGEKYQKEVFKQIEKNWGYMLYHNATSFWETILGADDFDDAGSLCHGWSAVPVYLYYSYILGIKPLEPGFKKVSLRPISAGFYEAEGKIKSPYGDIRMSWTKVNGKIIVKKLLSEEIEVC